MTQSLTLAPDNVPAIAPEVFRRVWRTSLDQPGFALLRFARAVSSFELRRAMVELVATFPTVRTGELPAGSPEPPPVFVPERFGRFDQQVSSKFHRDGAPPASLLVLGYEPTVVFSRFWIADSSAAASAAGLSLKDYLAAHNPMFPDGEAKLAPHITELDLPRGEAFLVVVNNSLLPLDGTNPLGVLHKAVIPSPDPAGRRVINSIGFTPHAPGVGLPPTELERFLARDDLD